MSESPTAGRWRRIAIVGLPLFVGYFGIFAFRFPWSGDVHVYLAAIHALYAQPWLPAHPYLTAVPESYVYTPYILSVSAVGQALDLTPYRALQVAALGNAAFLYGAVFLFFRTFSAVRWSVWGPVGFLIATLLLRSESYVWSSELSLPTLRFIVSYPSVLAWAVALVCFVLAHRALHGTPRRWESLLLGGLLWFVTLSHQLTASWVIGLLGVMGIVALVEHGVTKGRAVLRLGVTMGVALGMTLLWPYFEIGSVFALTGVSEGAPFGTRPLQLSPFAYGLALLSLAMGRPSGRYRLWIWAFIATAGAWATFRLLGISFGDRYVYFMLFIAHFLAADGLAWSLAWWRRRRPDLRARIGGMEAVTATYPALFGIALLLSPIFRRYWFQAVVLPLMLVTSGASTEARYYDRWTSARSVVQPSDVLMAPDERESVDLAAVTGARAIWGIFSWTVPQAAARAQDTRLFFDSTTSPAVRWEALRRWSASRVVLILPNESLQRTFDADFGPPLWSDQQVRVYDSRRVLMEDR